MGRPDVTYVLIAINVVVFVYELFLGGIERDIFFFKYGLIPAELTTGKEVPLPVRTSFGVVGLDVGSPLPPWGTVFTSMFIHGGPIHIVANMLFLYGFGGYVESKLGHVRYLLFYLAAGVAAAWTQVAVEMDSQSPMIGASGAIFGVLGAYLLAFPYRHTLALIFVFFILPLLFNVGSMSPVISGGGIAYMAHVGGFVAGALFMAGYKLLLREPILPGRRWPPWRRYR